MSRDATVRSLIPFDYLVLCLGRSSPRIQPRFSLISKLLGGDIRACLIESRPFYLTMGLSWQKVRCTKKFPSIVFHSKRNVHQNSLWVIPWWGLTCLYVRLKHCPSAPCTIHQHPRLWQSKTLLWSTSCSSVVQLVSHRASSKATRLFLTK